MMQFKIISNIISKEESDNLAEQFNILNLGYTIEEGVSKPSEVIFNFKYATIIQERITEIISKKFNKNLGITYNCMRKYFKDSNLVTHTDRKECEYSLTMHIKSSEENATWPLYYKIGRNRKYVNLKQGDCFLYKGIELPHGRENCPVDWYLQLFMHWVDLDGDYGHCFKNKDERCVNF